MIRSKLKSGVQRLLGRPAPSTTPSAAPPPPPGDTTPPAPSQQDTPASSSINPEQVARVIAEKIRPALQADGGDIELVELRGADAHVRLVGACRGCPGATMTLKMGVEALLRDEIPGFGSVVDLG
jgi:Fe-S cluster biogenesis protein NfuA